MWSSSLSYDSWHEDNITSTDDQNKNNNNWYDTIFKEVIDEIEYFLMSSNILRKLSK